MEQIRVRSRGSAPPAPGCPRRERLADQQHPSTWVEDPLVLYGTLLLGASCAIRRTTATGFMNAANDWCRFGLAFDHDRREFPVTVLPPSDPELTSLGGSGGPILELQVSKPGRPTFSPTTIQALWLFVPLSGKSIPEFSVWGKTGISSYIEMPAGLRAPATAWCGSGLRRRRFHSSTDRQSSARSNMQLKSLSKGPPPKRPGG